MQWQDAIIETLRNRGVCVIFYSITVFSGDFYAAEQGLFIAVYSVSISF